MRKFLLVGIVLALAGCNGFEKGSDVGLGFDALNTQSKEDKDNEKWFDGFYGKSHCTWGSCSSDDTSGGGGGGGMWGGGVGPSDSGSSN